MRLIIATKNKFKFREIRQILRGVSIPVVSLFELKQCWRILEKGKTFLENARRKAIPVSKAYPDDLVLGEDSGLEVDYLGGKPGIYSKRYAARSGNQLKNNAKLLKELANVPYQKRTAHFVCCLALARRGKLVKAFEGKLGGKINAEPRGGGGFGYDPVMYLPAYHKTVAQLPLRVKNQISHRSKASRKLKTYLRRRHTSGKEE